MADPYVGEIRLFGGNFEPDGWAFCSGQLLPVYAYPTLFTLIGTTYGGDGQSTFALPDLRGRTPVHQGATGLGYVLGRPGGADTVQLTTDHLPTHAHPFMGTNADLTASPKGASPAVLDSSSDAGVRLYAATAKTSLNPKSVDAAGGSSAHDNHQPSLCVNFIIALTGDFPPKPKP